MMKPVTATKVKLSITNNRVAITATYVNGQILKLALSASSGSAGCSSPAGFTAEVVQKSDLVMLSKIVNELPDDQSPSTHFKRLAALLEGTTSVVDAASKFAK